MKLGPYARWAARFPHAGVNPFYAAPEVVLRYCLIRGKLERANMRRRQGRARLEERHARRRAYKRDYDRKVQERMRARARLTRGTCPCALCLAARTWGYAPPCPFGAVE